MEPLVEAFKSVSEMTLTNDKALLRLSEVIIDRLVALEKKVIRLENQIKDLTTETK